MSPPPARSGTIKPRATDSQSPRPAATWLKAFLLACAVLAVYQPCFRGRFIFDDDLYTSVNGLVPAPNGLQGIWFSTAQPEYYPVSYSLFWLEWRLWGANPTGYHIVSVILHLVAALLVWATLAKIEILAAYFAALLFAVHPVNVESVAWVFQFRGILATIFFLTSIFCFLNAQDETLIARHKHHAWYWLSLAAFVVAMLSKGSVAILPLVLLLLIWWTNRRINLADCIHIVPFFVVAIAFTLVNLWFQTRAFAEPVRSADLSERLACAGAVLWFYLSKAFVPIHLAIIYPLWHVNSANLLWWIPTATVTVITAALVWKRTRRYAASLLLAWAFVGVALLPVLGFTDIGYMKYSLVADRYAYLAIIGVSGLIATAWQFARQQSPALARFALNAMAVATLAVLMLLCRQQSALFADPVSLYRSALNENPQSWMMQNLLGNEFAQSGHAPEAIQHYQQALQLNPKHPLAHSNLGYLLAQEGQTEAGVEHLKEAIRLNPKLADAHNNLGLVLAGTGDTTKAIDQYQQALRLKPDFVEAWTNLAMADAKAGRSADAITAAQHALDLATTLNQTTLAQQIRTWLEAYRSGAKNPGHFKGK